MTYGKNRFGRMLAVLLCVVLMGSIAMPVGAEEPIGVQWTGKNSIIVKVVTDQSRNFTPEDFPEVDCIATVIGEKSTDETGVHYVVVLVLEHAGDEAITEAIEKAKVNPLVEYATRNDYYELWDYQFTLNHSTYVLRLGETVDLQVTNVHRPIVPGVVHCIQFTVDRNHIDDSEENIVEVFAEYGITRFWIDQKHYEGLSPYENTRSEQGVYFASIDSGKTSYEMMAPLAQSDGFKEVSLPVEFYVGGVALGGTWSIDKPALADMIPSEKGGVTIHAVKPGTVVITREQSYYEKNPIQTCTITILDEYTPGDITKDANVNAVDALRVLQYSVEKITLNPEEISLADMNGDDAIDAEDALMILQKAVGELQ